MMEGQRRISPFSRLKVKVSDVDYDFEDSDLDWSIAEEDKPPTEGTIEWMAEELFDENVLTKDENGWIIDEGELEELVSDRISSDTGWCHNGFAFSYTVSD